MMVIKCKKKVFKFYKFFDDKTEIMRAILESEKSNK